jgi:hypothetical protein
MRNSPAGGGAHYAAKTRVRQAPYRDTVPNGIALRRPGTATERTIRHPWKRNKTKSRMERLPIPASITLETMPQPEIPKDRQQSAGNGTVTKGITGRHDMNKGNKHGNGKHGVKGNTKPEPKREIIGEPLTDTRSTRESPSGPKGAVHEQLYRRERRLVTPNRTVQVLRTPIAEPPTVYVACISMCSAEGYAYGIINDCGPGGRRRHSCRRASSLLESRPSRQHPRRRVVRTTDRSNPR